MIRNVVMGRLADGADGAAEDRLAGALAGIAALELEGMLANQVGRDAGIRAGGWTFAIINDWRDEAAYWAYDAEVEHNRHRAVIAEVCSAIARVQFDVP